MRKGLVERGLKAARLAQANFAPELFDHDDMIITSVLIAEGLSVTVKSNEEFSGNFKAAAQQATEVHAELEFKAVDQTSYVLNVAETKEFLFGVAAIEPEDIK